MQGKLGQENSTKSVVDITYEQEYFIFSYIPLQGTSSPHMTVGGGESNKKNVGFTWLEEMKEIPILKPNPTRSLSFYIRILIQPPPPVD